MRSRHRLSKFLLRRGHRFPCKAWTQPHERWLGKLSFEDALSQATFVDYLCAVQALVQRRRALIERSKQAVPASKPRRRRSRGCAASAGSTRSPLPGCARKSATFTRFAKPSLLSGFLGVVPSEYTSDEKRTQGQITKAGPPHARRLLVEAAHHYRHRPAVRSGPQSAPGRTGPESRADRLALPAPPARALDASRRVRAESGPGPSRSPARASSPRSAGRPRPWTDTSRHTTAPGGCRGATSNKQGRHVADQRARDHGLWATCGFTRRAAPDSRLRARRRTRVLR